MSVFCIMRVNSYVRGAGVGQKFLPAQSSRPHSPSTNLFHNESGEPNTALVWAIHAGEYSVSKGLPKQTSPRFYRLLYLTFRSRPAVLLEKSGNDRLIWSRLSCITPLIRVCSVEVWVRSSSQKTFSLPRDLLLACRRRQTRLGWVHWHWKLRQWININITYICTSFLMNTDTCIFYTLVAALVLAVNAGRGFRKTVPTQAVEGVLCMFGAQSTMGLERKVQSHPISAPMY